MWMVLVALTLDVMIYPWLIRFQPRWLTILLGVMEFAILVLVVPPPADVGIMLGFYLPAWGLAWLTMEIALPLAWPRWIEDGGEIRFS